MPFYLIYFLIVIAATTLGAVTGMGGGIIIKPVLDMMKGYDAATIGILSSISVFSMAVVSVLKQIQQKIKIKYNIAIPLALGSVTGGIIGEKMLSVIIARLGENSKVTIVQNIILATLIVCIFFYMLNKSKIRTLGITNVFPVVIAGVFLGIISSFLGIGGGPINVALLIFIFSFDIKTATLCSIITILFAQISKLSLVALSTGFSGYDLSMLPPMLVGAVSGGFIGSRLNKKLSEKAVVICFNGVQCLVFSICIYNIIINLM